ncbi:MAG TPA: hypothetical protein VN702_23720, partial [Acetobacteraceae bacterium]|nr:hypothetical protein [Acetobacteraceae bacterium]
MVTPKAASQRTRMPQVRHPNGDQQEFEMGGKKDRKKSEEAAGAAASAPDDKLKLKAYLRELGRLHVELVKLQEWVVHAKAKVCIVFEGRDGAGKGGTIKAITERVSPRIFRVVALPAPSEREKSQMY